MVDEQHTGATNDLGPLETAVGGPVDPNAPPTPLVEPGVDLSGASITEVASGLDLDAEQRKHQERIWRWREVIERGETAGLHPNVLEALKRLELARGEIIKATENIDGQYLKSLDHATPDHAAQADAVRALMGR